MANKLVERMESTAVVSLGVRPASAEPPAPAAPPPSAGSPEDGRSRHRDAGHMEIDRIVPDPDQPRKEFAEDAIRQLAESIKKFGILLPLRVRWSQDLGKWILLSGERRLRAAARAGLKTVPCIFVDRDLSAEEILEEQLIENLQRQDLKPIEQANAFHTLMGKKGWSAREVAAALHMHESSVSRALALLALPAEVQEKVETGAIPASAGYEISKLKDEDAQREVAVRVASENLTREATAELVKEKKGRPPQQRERASQKTEESFAVANGGLVIVRFKHAASIEETLAALQEAVRKAKAKKASTSAAA
jgi:ParB family chromosome partitioning protein